MSWLAWTSLRIILARAPKTGWVRIHCTKVRERVTREGRRRINVVGVFLDKPSLTRQVGALRVERSHEGEIERGYFPCLERARTGSLETVRKLTELKQTLVAEPIPLRLESIR
ncbi:MAG: transposase [Anaerolineales bacterium]|jgi:transposase-like protein